MAKDYKVRVNFGGYYNCDKVYEVYAEDEDDAIEQAMQLALEDCNFEIEDEDDNEDEEY